MPSPTWIAALIGLVGEALEPELPQIGVGHTVRKLSKRGRPWRINIFPTRVELLEMGPADGMRFRPDFALCISQLIAVFDTTPHIDWIVPARYHGMLDGPRMLLVGHYKRHAVELHIFDRSPKDWASVLVYNSSSGECHLRQE